MRTGILSLVLLTVSLSALSQRLVEVLNETITINSSTSMNGHTRNVAEIRLSKGTIGYTYRISTFKRGGVSISNKLYSILQNLPVSQISAGMNLAQFAISQSDGQQIDYFVFTTPQDKSAFYNKRDGAWSSCKSFPNRVNTCMSSNDCINELIWFGFKNNNIAQGLDVHLEVVALVDDVKQDGQYSFKITNDAERDINFQLSTDGINWIECSLRANYWGTWNYSQSSIMFRLMTTDRGMVAYKINSNERYKISLNKATLRWDLFNY